MDTDSAYIAIAADQLDDLVTPELREAYQKEKHHWFPAEQPRFYIVFMLKHAWLGGYTDTTHINLQWRSRMGKQHFIAYICIYTTRNNNDDAITLPVVCSSEGGALYPRSTHLSQPPRLNHRKRGAISTYYTT